MTPWAIGRRSVGIELAAAIDVERNLPGGDADIADAPLEADAAGGNLENFANRLAAQLYRLRRAGQSEARIDDVIADRQNESRRRRLLLFDQAKHAGRIGLGGINAPDEAAANRRGVMPVTGGNRERHLSGRSHRQ